jgi:predicted DNA-binding transcriptional regulator YafY
MSEFREYLWFMQRIERLSAISDRLNHVRPGIVSAQTLADELGVTRRTIERDLVALRNAGLPIYATAGRNGGTGTVANSGSRMVTLTDAELIALIVAAQINTDGPFATAGRGAIAKLLNSLEPARRVAVEETRKRFRIATQPSPTGLTEAQSRRVRSIIEDGIQQQRVIGISYSDRNNVISNRQVEPIGLYFSNGDWSLIAWCTTRRGRRLFRVNRITKARLTRQACHPRNVDSTLGWVPAPGKQP